MMYLCIVCSIVGLGIHPPVGTAYKPSLQVLCIAQLEALLLLYNQTMWRT